MNSDIRLDVRFWDHPKTLRLVREFGLKAAVCVQRLWCYAAEFRPDGRLAELTTEDLCQACGWTGDQKALVDYLVEKRWLDQGVDCLVIHEWAEHQPWVIKSEERRKRARKAASCRWGLCSEHATSDAKPMHRACPEHAESNAQSMLDACPEHPLSNAKTEKDQCSNDAPKPITITKRNNNNKNYDNPTVSLNTPPKSPPAGGTVVVPREGALTFEFLLSLLPSSVGKLEKAAALLRAQLAEKGADYVYRNVLYTNRHGPKNYSAYLRRALEHDYGAELQKEIDGERRTEEEKAAKTKQDLAEREKLAAEREQYDKALKAFERLDQAERARRIDAVIRAHRGVMNFGRDSPLVLSTAVWEFAKETGDG